MPDADAYYVIAVANDGLVIARPVSSLALSLAALAPESLAYRGSDPCGKAQAASEALALVIEPPNSRAHFASRRRASRAA